MAVSAAPEVLDLLGLDPQSLGGGGAESANGLKKPNGDAVGNEAGAARPLMLTQLAVAPSMLGPVGAARGAASEMAALSAEVRGFGFDWITCCLLRGDCVVLKPW